MMEAMQDLRLDRVVARESSGQVGAIFEDFFDLEHERLLRALYLVVGERQEAEDLAQDAFVKVLERWETVRSMDSPTGYLYRTAMNTFRTRYRRAVMAVRRIAPSRAATAERLRGRRDDGGRPGGAVGPDAAPACRDRPDRTAWLWRARKRHRSWGSSPPP